MIGVLIAAVIGAGVVAPVLVARAPRQAGWLLAVVPAVATVWLVIQGTVIVEGGPVREGVAWVASFGLTASFWLDGLALLFALLITGIGALVVAFAGGYLRGDRRLLEAGRLHRVRHDRKRGRRSLPRER